MPDKKEPNEISTLRRKSVNVAAVSEYDQQIIEWLPSLYNLKERKWFKSHNEGFSAKETGED